MIVVEAEAKEIAGVFMSLSLYVLFFKHKCKQTQNSTCVKVSV